MVKPSVTRSSCLLLGLTIGRSAMTTCYLMLSLVLMTMVKIRYARDVVFDFEDEEKDRR